LELALNGEWDASHEIVQDFSDHYANWIHAVLHKIEGDEWNSRYWYKRTNGKSYEDFDDAEAELIQIQRLL
jgi:hypothetical protein